MRRTALLLVAATMSHAGPALADTIYLRSGRVIHSASVRVAGGRVYFTQLGGTVSIPLEAVGRIVEDDTVEQAASRPPQAEPAPLEAVVTGAESGETSTNSLAVPGAAAIGDASEALPSAPSTDSPEYWIERIHALDARIARVQAELDRLPFYDAVDERLLRYSGQALYFMAERRRWEAMMHDLKASRQRLLYGARKAGITPGALRRGLRR